MSEPVRGHDRDRAAIVAAVCERIAGGAKVSVACEKEGISWKALWNWKEENDAFQQQYRRAQRAAALLHVEQAVREAEAATPETVQVAKLRTDLHLRLAGMKDREEYGERQAQKVQVNIAQLHIEALKAAQPAVRQIAPPEIVVDAEPADER